MKNQTTKIINWLNIALTAIALILECMPRSVRYACMTGPNTYGPMHYWSYFGNPLSVDGPFLTTVIIGSLTILNLIFNVVALFKDKKPICIISAIVSFLVLITSAVVLSLSSKQFITAYNIIITILFLILFILQVVSLECNAKNKNIKLRIINWLNAALLFATIILESMSESVKYTYSYGSGHEAISYISYFAQPSGVISVFTAIVASSTVFAFLFGVVILIKDNRAMRITSLVWAALGSVINFVLIIILRKTITVYNIIIMLLLLVPIIVQSIKLKKSKEVNLNY